MDILKQCLMGLVERVAHDNRTGRFEEIVGHDDIKQIFEKAILSKRPVHLLLVGSPGSAKTMFLTEIMLYVYIIGIRAYYTYDISLEYVTSNCGLNTHTI